MPETLQRWDCHTHIFGPWEHFPLPPEPAYRPDEASFAYLRRTHASMGITHGVLIQAACYGQDHGALLAALDQSGHRYRGIALIEPDVDEAVLQDMHARGVRGIRLGLMPHLPADHSTQRMRDLLQRIAPYGWHALIHGQLPVVVKTLNTLKDSPVPLVVDHMGRMPVTTPDSAAFDALLAHLARPEVWIKVSGADRVSAGRRPFADALPLMRHLLDAAPDRTIWGTDWPHVNITSDTPDAGELLQLLRLACGDPAREAAVLHHNPLRLYA